MRDNGLSASQWTHLADVDPRIGQAALDALRDAGVAAYTVPHTGAAGPYLDVHLPDRPTDRLFVEFGARERATVVLASLGRSSRSGSGHDSANDSAESDVDARFAAIVAQFEEEDPTGSSTTAPPAAELPAPTGGRLVRDVGWDDLLADQPPDEDPAAVDPDDDERYVPPPPPPLPQGTPVRRFAWLALIGAPVVVLLSVLTDRSLNGWLGLFVVAAFVGGLGTLFATMRDDAPDDTDPDHGAVV